MEKEVFLEKLPLKNPGGKIKIYDWEEIIKKDIPIPFIYDDIKGEIHILEEYKKEKAVKVFIEGYTDGGIIKKNDIVRCRIAALLKKFTKEYKYNVGNVLSTKHGDITITEQCKVPYEGRGKDSGKIFSIKGYKVYCKKHNLSTILSEEKIKSGIGCPLCSGSNSYCEEGINDIATTNPELVKYFVNEEDTKKYKRGSDKFVLMRCPDCGFTLNYPIKALSQYKFPCACSDNINYPNRLMMNILLQTGVEFYAEVSNKVFDWLPPHLRYDFYVKTEKYQFLIEMDGHLHSHSIKKYDYKSLEWRKKLDTVKNKLAREHGIILIRIQCDYPSLEERHNYIVKQILNSPIATMIDLSNVNFIEAEKKSLPSIVFKICDEYNSGQLHLGLIAQKYNLNVGTIRKYLVILQSIGLCNYCENVNKHKRKI